MKRNFPVTLRPVPCSGTCVRTFHLYQPIVGGKQPDAGAGLVNLHSKRKSSSWYEDVQLSDFHDRVFGQERKSSPDALRRSAGVNSFWFLAACLPLSRGSFLIEEPDFHLLARFLTAQKIEFAFSCQSRNLSTGGSRACAPSPSRILAGYGSKKSSLFR
jgi:hypothetical protein